MTRLTSTAALLTFASLAPAPVTHVVRLDPNSFLPAETRAAPGDTIRFLNGNGGPHNVVFARDSIATEARALIDAAMPQPKIMELSSGMLILQDEAYTIVVPRLRAGRYAFFCSPHYAQMRGAVVVSP